MDLKEENYLIIEELENNGGYVATKEYYQHGDTTVYEHCTNVALRFPYVIGTSTGISSVYGYIADQQGYAKEYLTQFLFPDYASSIKKIKKAEQEKTVLNINSILSSDVKYEVVLTNCESGKPEYFNDFIDEEFLKSVEKASYSMLVLSRMIKIDEHLYMDGGISDAIPINRAYEMGNKKNVVILSTNRIHLSNIPTYQKILYERTYRKYPMFLDTIMNQNTMYQQKLDFVLEEEKRGNIFVIRPEIPEIKRLETDYDALIKYYKHGCEVAKQKWDALTRFLNG